MLRTEFKNVHAYVQLQKVNLHSKHCWARTDQQWELPLSPHTALLCPKKVITMQLSVMTLLSLQHTDSVMLPGNRAASLLTHQPLSLTISLTLLGGWRLSVRGCTPLVDTAPIVMLGSLPCSLPRAHRIHMQYNAILRYHFAGGRMASSRARKVNSSRSQTHPTLLLA